MKERGKMKVAAFFQGLPRSDAHWQPSCSSTALARRGDALQHPLTPQSPGSVGATQGSPLTHILDSSQGRARPAAWAGLFQLPRLAPAGVTLSALN